MEIAFYKASCGNWLDKSIDFFSGRYGYSHVELVFENNLCFSISSREKICRFKQIENLRTSGHWDFAKLNLQKNEDYYINRAKKYEGIKYDYLALGSYFLLPQFYENSNRFTCTEVVAYTIECYVTLTPNDMAKVFKVEKTF